jgi:hypothetical protein
MPGTPSSRSFVTTPATEKLRETKNTGTPSRVANENASPFAIRGNW